MSVVDAPVGRLASHADAGENLFMVGANGKLGSVRGIDGKATRQDRTYRLGRTFPAARSGHTLRSHLGNNSSLHWWRDAVMNGDRSRTRRGNGPNHLAVLRRTALNITRRGQSKGSKRAKFERAA